MTTILETEPLAANAAVTLKHPRAAISGRHSRVVGDPPHLRDALV